jgi:glycine/D-amino acid oxidase-like deaminating enzyme
VIGAGVLGAATAMELARRGLDTIVVDRAAAAGHGSTGNSSAIVRGHYSTQEGVAIAVESCRRWERWRDWLDCEDEAGYAHLVAVGTALLDDGGSHAERVLDHYAALGVEHEVWNATTLVEHLPIIDPRSFGPPKRTSDPAFWWEPRKLIPRAIYTPWSGYVNDPQLATHNLQRAAERFGARFRFRATVDEIECRGGSVAGIRLRGGQRIASPVVVNVAGPHSPTFNRQLGIEGEMNVQNRALRAEIHHVPAPQGFDFELNGLHISDPDLGIDFRPEVGNNISIGSEIPACDPKIWVDDPDNYDDRSLQTWQTQVLRLARRLPSLGIPHQRKGIVDLYDVTDDWAPIYDRSSIRGYFMAIGTSGNQFKNAPVVGELMARLVTSSLNGRDHDQNPISFTLSETSVELNIGYYSRLRTPHHGGSDSVMG